MYLHTQYSMGRAHTHVHVATMNMEENYKHDDIISCVASECCLRVIGLSILHSHHVHTTCTSSQGQCVCVHMHTR